MNKTVHEMNQGKEKQNGLGSTCKLQGSPMLSCHHNDDFAITTQQFGGPLQGFLFCLSLLCLSTSEFMLFLTLLLMLCPHLQKQLPAAVFFPMLELLLNFHSICPKGISFPSSPAFLVLFFSSFVLCFHCFKLQDVPDEQTVDWCSIVWFYWCCSC